MNTPTKRQHTSRIRKPNPRFENEDVYIASPKSRKQLKPQKLSSIKSETPDKRVSHALVHRLRNLLKLPKAHKWVLYEWFYSTIDSALLEGENDFQIFLSQSFPQLNCRKLRRMEWCAIRRLMGKPRRCSEAFFAEERISLSERRERIRILQQQKTYDLAKLIDMPSHIPMPLVIGTKVTARLRYPQDGLFVGKIDAVDTLNNTYRIIFDRMDIEPQIVSDFEVQSNEHVEVLPLSSFQIPQRRNPHLSANKYVYSSSAWENDPLLNSSPLGNRIPTLPEDGTYGGFPVKMLIQTIKLTKILDLKKEKIQELREMNSEAEDMSTRDIEIPVHFKQKYANKILELEGINSELDGYMDGVQEASKRLAEEHNTPLPTEAADVKHKCDLNARDIFSKANSQPGHNMVQGDHSINLITKLTSILLQMKCYADSDGSTFELGSLQETINDIKDSIDESNLECFQDNVEVHINHILGGMNSAPNGSRY